MGGGSSSGWSGRREYDSARPVRGTLHHLVAALPYYSRTPPALCNSDREGRNERMFDQAPPNAQAGDRVNGEARRTLRGPNTHALHSTMSISITSQISSISQRLRAAEKILQDVAFDAKYVWNDGILCVRWLKSSFQYREFRPRKG